MKRKILLLNPGYHEFGDYGYYHQSPMGLLKIGSYFKKTNKEVHFIDCSIPPKLMDTGCNLKEYYKDAPFVRMVKCGNHENEGISKAQKYYGLPHRIIRERVKSINPTEVWVGSGLTYYWESVRDCIDIVKDTIPGVPVLLGGIYPTLYPDHASSNTRADYIHIGPLDDIDDELPDYSLYGNQQIETSRTIQLGKGCNVNPPCSFCAVVAMDPKFRSLAPDKVFDYILHEHRNRSVSFFRIWSSQLLVPKPRFIDLMTKIVDSKIKISMVASEGVQPSLFDQNVSDLMYKAGFYSVSIPMESIDSSRVEEFRKPGDFNDYEAAVKCAQKTGFKTIKSFVMIGVPGQRIDEMVHGIVDCWARDVSPALHQYTPIPGSHDWTRFPQFHGISPEELHPSLWPAANKDMTVEALEEIKKIAKIGPYRLYYAIKSGVEVRVPEVWDMFKKWCISYKIMKPNFSPTFERPLALPGYTSSWTDHCKKVGII